MSEVLEAPARGKCLLARASGGGGACDVSFSRAMKGPDTSAGPHGSELRGRSPGGSAATKLAVLATRRRAARSATPSPARPSRPLAHMK